MALDNDNLENLLKQSSPDEPRTVADLRDRACQIIYPPDSPLDTTSQSSDRAYTLLTTVIKPLFSKSQHRDLTQTGRRNLVVQPSFPNRFSDDDSIFSEPSWKTPWINPLLQYILALHESKPIQSVQDDRSDNNGPTTRKGVIEAHYYLLTPAILHHLDDTSTVTKAQGCNLLHSLSQILITVHSEILKRTGLAEVFLDALKNCFNYIPTLTPEDESLHLMKAMYPAYLAVIEARCIDDSKFNQTSIKTNTRRREEKDLIITITASSKTTTTTTTDKKSKQTQPPDHQFRTTHLNHLLRSSLLHTLSHLSTTPTTPSLTTTTSPNLTRYLTTQIPPILHGLQKTSSIHLQHIIPLLTSTLRDPFSMSTETTTTTTSGVSLIDEVVIVLEEIVETCPERIGERWWVEILRGCVASFLGVCDEIDGIDEEKSSGDRVRVLELEKLRMRVKGLIGKLKGVVEKVEWDTCVVRLVEEEPELEEAFQDLERKVWKRGGM